MKPNWSLIIDGSDNIYYDGHKWKIDTDNVVVKQATIMIYELIINNLKQNITIFFPTGEPELSARYKIMSYSNLYRQLIICYFFINDTK